MEWDAKVRELSERGVVLRSLLEFYAKLVSADGPVPRFNPRRSTTKDVVRNYIIPMTKEVSFAKEAAVQHQSAQKRGGERPPGVVTPGSLLYPT